MRICFIWFLIMFVDTLLNVLVIISSVNELNLKLKLNCGIKIAHYCHFIPFKVLFKSWWNVSVTSFASSAVCAEIWVMKNKSIWMSIDQSRGLSDTGKIFVMCLSVSLFMMIHTTCWSSLCFLISIFDVHLFYIIHYQFIAFSFH